MKLSKVISLEQAVSMIPDGANIGIGGFIGCGHPQEFSVGIEDAEDIIADLEQALNA